MKKYLIIINPVAGTGDIKYSIEKIKRKFEDKKAMFEIVLSNKEGNITELASQAEKLGFTDIIAVGGDGTLLEAFNGIIETKLRLGIIPSGTGNDFAKSLNVPMDIDKAIEIIFEEKLKSVDYGKINDQFFLNVAGVGIDADIVMEAARIKNKIPGPMAYLTSTLKILMKYKCKRVKVIIDDMIIDKEVYLVAVGNGKYFGGGMKITPDAELDDGLFDICLIDKISKAKFATIFPKVFSGKHINYNMVHSYRGKNIQIIPCENMYINADGNIIGETPCNITMVKNGIEVYAGPKL